MHKENYNINIACFCNNNLTNALDELKIFLSFNIISDPITLASLQEKKINAVIYDIENSKKVSLLDLKKPKILIHNTKNTNILKNNYSLIVKLPLDFFQFNQDVVNICKKFEFKNNSLISIKDYILDKNERVLRKKDVSLKITEKEIDFIENLKLSSKPLSRDFILKNIWNYSTDTDTHTVETHIYRLRQKIKNHFKDDNFIKNSKKGYSL